MDNFTLKIKGSSDVCVTFGLQRLTELLPAARIVIITDHNLEHHYAAQLDAISEERIVIGEGETNKTLQTMEQIYTELIEMGADRKTFLLGFGGGIVTDITGFVAATYLRGVDFGFVSTTLLSQVDAGVGGKNGVNLGGYKNMVGTFNQPRFVICAVDMLRTLDNREVRAGIAEITKSAIIDDVELFEMLEGVSFDEYRGNEDLIARSIVSSVKIKAAIVERDEKESGERRKLNLGHTFAHAIEKLSNKMIHGEAVAVGTIIATNISLSLGLISKEDADRIYNIHATLGFDLTPPLPVEELLKAIVKDKKAEEGSIYMVLPTKIGHCEVRKMSFAEVAQAVR
ncbi:MAG: 3-dehydroquinate synthase [Rikenellaceae bacterium]